MKKPGRIIIPDGAYPEDHEIATARSLIKLGSDVEFLVPIRTRGVRTPDITWDGLDWEIKSPIGKGKRTIQDQFKNALHQSKCVIFDGRRCKQSDEKVESELRRQASLTRSAKRLLYINKENEIVDIKK
jgi:hypothetical protein